MSDIPQIKSEQRRALRQRRASLSAGQQLTAARTLVNTVVQLPDWSGARRIALYMAADGEIGTGFLESEARGIGKEIYLPVLTGDNRLEFARWESDDPLGSNRYNILEPLPTASRCPIAQLDIVFLPLVGWDRFGCRLGMGGGFYDRTLANNAGPLLVGLAHECQQVEALPREEWDIVLDYIATEAVLHRRRESRG